MAETVTGAEYLARSLAANGTSHVFFIYAVLRRTLIELHPRCAAGARP
jgi:acetolactate synthase-1/2/3 large subunit